MILDPLNRIVRSISQSISHFQVHLLNNPFVKSFIRNAFGKLLRCILKNK
jgi:hypothetical protein